MLTAEIKEVIFRNWRQAIEKKGLKVYRNNNKMRVMGKMKENAVVGSCPCGWGMLQWSEGELYPVQ